MKRHSGSLSKRFKQRRDHGCADPQVSCLHSDNVQGVGMEAVIGLKNEVRVLTGPGVLDIGELG